MIISLLAVLAVACMYMHPSSGALTERAHIPYPEEMRAVLNGTDLKWNGKEKGVSGSCGWDSYLQCDSAWGSEPLGTSSVNTICSAGCAMTSVAMALGHWGTHKNPGSLNSWLNKNGGYADTDLIIWATVDDFGLSFQGIEYDVSVDTLANGISECHAIIANVLEGSHWVLLTGYAGNNEFYVNDPAAFYSTYAYSGMLQWAVYH